MLVLFLLDQTGREESIYITLAALGWWVPKTLSGVCLETFFSICKVKNHNMVVLFYMNSFQNVMIPFKVCFIYRGKGSPTYAIFTIMYLAPIH